MRTNTTEHLLRHMERLREHRGIGRWMLMGGSWGSTLSLAYAQRHPDRVTGIVLSQVMTSRRGEIDWLYRGAARLFPGEWEQFRDGVPEADRDGDLVAAYARLLESSDAEVRAAAAGRWRAWEDAVLSLEPNARTPRPPRPPGPPTAATQAFARLCAHYFSHGAWLEDGALIREAGRLAGIPAC
ncbi:MAG: alpha/beta fold hydrolase [Streptosporangiaceae bacterium]